MKTIEIKKMLKARHPEVFKNYSKIKIKELSIVENNIGIHPENNTSIKIYVHYEGTNYSCHDIPTAPDSAEKYYIIQELYPTLKYLIGFRNGFSPSGETGTCKTYLRTKGKLKELGIMFKKAYNHDEVYLLNQYTQKMCEMGIAEFTEYVRKNGEKLA